MSGSAGYKNVLLFVEWTAAFSVEKFCLAGEIKVREGAYLVVAAALVEALGVGVDIRDEEVEVRGVRELGLKILDKGGAHALIASGTSGAEEYNQGFELDAFGEHGDKTHKLKVAKSAHYFNAGHAQCVKTALWGEL